MLNRLKNSVLLALVLLLALPLDAFSGGTEELVGPECQLQPPAPVVPLSVTTTSIKIGWPSLPMAVRYRIRYRDLSVPGAPTITVFRLAPIHEFTATGLVSGHSYEFKVSATKCSGQSSDFGGGESVLTVTTDSCALPPPTSIFATHLTPMSIRIEWNPVPMATTYRIRYQDLTAGTPPITVFRTAPINFLQVGNLIPGHTYLFLVSASKCSNQYGAEANFAATTPYIVIDDTVWENCCPIESDSTIKNGGTKDTLYFTPGSDEGYHIKSVWFSNSTRYYDFCLHVGTSRELIVTPVDSLNTQTTANTGAVWTVKYLNTLSALKAFFTATYTMWDAASGQSMVVITWNAKSRVFVEACSASPRPGHLDWRAQGATLAPAKVLPNPFADRLFLQLPENEEDGPAQVTLFNLNGQALLRREQCSGALELATESLQPGIYFLKIAWSTGRQETLKVLKN